MDLMLVEDQVLAEKYHMLLNAPLCFEALVFLLYGNHSHFPILEYHKQYANKIMHGIYFS